MKKIIRFVIAVLAAPIYVPFMAIFALTMLAYEFLDSNPQYEFWRNYMLSSFNWYILK